MKPLYDLAQLREIEQAHAADGLMEKAGLAAARMVRDLLREHEYAVLVLAGPGNNGGDALVAARHLKAGWHQVTVVFTGERASLPPDAAAAYDAWIADGGEVYAEVPVSHPVHGHWQLVVDGLFGIGLTRDLDARYRTLIDDVNALGLPVLALDIPSGLCMATGRVLGAAIKATHTLSFIGLKPGLFTLDGPDHAGEVHLDALGLEGEALGHAAGQLVDHPPVLPLPRKLNSHKGSHGSVGVIGGAEHMVGAAILTSRAALLLGAGRVYCGLLANDAPGLDAGQAELMLRDVAGVPELSTVLAVGPGMGQSNRSLDVLREVLALPQPMVLDADALNLVAAHAGLKQLLRQRIPGSTVLTPHPGEAASLLVCSNAELQADRIGNALKLAQEYQAVIVLKGCGSIVAMPDGRWFINHSGNPGLASAGMGDTLCGMIAALLAQSMTMEEAVLLAVYLHGAAADLLVEQGTGPIGLTASEVAVSARELLNRWVYG
ncbi:NAD(P)H-hydrate dehydratase [Methylobacillus arboreus]|uniref:NAD(P)H-hydrate dehydratase n=1 Tax=Methylobacillus arboreus TaxID=755170 RepID=UPI001E5B1A56|nr:NAD(P)H-hydrate dehydratase [Methylobacillus arboreus]MCB5189349.1 NAD(P)H-hydrate dehydratase [Methylobacillus arboreus]